MIRLLCAVLCAVLTVLCLVGCDDSPTGQESTSSLEETTQSAPVSSGSALRLPYAPEDSLNPFYMTSLINSSFVGLLFRSLYKMDSSCSRVNDIAVSETISDASVRVTFASDSVFSDGSLMTARDVVYSFNLAKSSYLYAGELSSFSQAYITGDYSVEFMLTSPDVFSAGCLTFPIVRQGTADTQDSVPVGSGQYMYNENGKELTLVENQFSSVPLNTIKEITLVRIEDDAALIFLLETQLLDVCFSELTTGEATRIDAATKAVAMNNLVFAGFNPANEEFLLADVRRAISLLLDRTEIVENAFYSRADAAALPLHPLCTEALNSQFAQAVSLDADESGALRLLSDAGFSGVSGYGIRYSGYTSMEYTLLYCSDTGFKTDCAEYMARVLTEQGIIITLKGLAFDEYKTAIENGEYDIYLGEIRLQPSMSLSSFFNQDGETFCGACISTSLANTYNGWRSGTVSTDTFLSSFSGEMPFIPLCFRSGVLCYSRSIKSSVTASNQNPYENISEWTVS